MKFTEVHQNIARGVPQNTIHSVSQNLYGNSKESHPQEIPREILPRIDPKILPGIESKILPENSQELLMGIPLENLP